MVRPAKVGLYLIVGILPDKEINWPDPQGVVLGKLFELYDPQEGDIKTMYEKWIEVLHVHR